MKRREFITLIGGALRIGLGDGRERDEGDKMRARQSRSPPD
jgi:hypothetical protein